MPPDVHFTPTSWLVNVYSKGLFPVRDRKREDKGTPARKPSQVGPRRSGPVPLRMGELADQPPRQEQCWGQSKGTVRDSHRDAVLQDQSQSQSVQHQSVTSLSPVQHPSAGCVLSGDGRGPISGRALSHQGLNLQPFWISSRTMSSNPPVIMITDMSDMRAHACGSHSSVLLFLPAELRQQLLRLSSATLKLGFCSEGEVSRRSALASRFAADNNVIITRRLTFARAHPPLPPPPLPPALGLRVSVQHVHPEQNFPEDEASCTALSG